MASEDDKSTTRQTIKRLWLIFAQAVTVFAAFWFVLLIFKPEWTGIGRLYGRGARTRNVYREAAAKVMPSVVNIYTADKGTGANLSQFYRTRPVAGTSQYSLGSGVIATSDGYILTNHHVIEDAEAIQVAFQNGKTAPARLIGVDPDTDLAVLKVDMTNLPAVQFGDMGKVKIGDSVLAIGNPYGFQHTVTMGIVSSLDRSQLGLNTYEDFIQIDAAINPGNSGGALIDIDGNLIGINSAGYTETEDSGSVGIGFAIPISTAKLIMEQIIATGHVTRGWIGAEVFDITPELAEQASLKRDYGVVLVDLDPKGPAKKCGLSTGDIVISMNGTAIENTSQLLIMIAQQPPGSTATFVILRDNTELTINVNIVQRPTKKKKGEDDLPQG